MMIILKDLLIIIFLNMFWESRTWTWACWRIHILTTPGTNVFLNPVISVLLGQPGIGRGALENTRVDQFVERSLYDAGQYQSVLQGELSMYCLRLLSVHWRWCLHGGNGSCHQNGPEALCSRERFYVCSPVFQGSTNYGRVEWTLWAKIQAASYFQSKPCIWARWQCRFPIMVCR